MGMQDRDYYREHVKQRAREEANERDFRTGPPSLTTRQWLVVGLIVSLGCACAYLGVQVVKLREQLALAERVLRQQTEQMRADRTRMQRQQPPPPKPAPKVEFFR